MHAKEFNMKSMAGPLPMTLAISMLVMAGCGNNQNAANAQTTGEPTADKAPASAPTKTAVVAHYADLAHATFQDAVVTAEALDKAVDTLISEPTEANLEAAKQAWLAARVPYQQSEVFRFGNAIVDDWEGQLNAWPLDEGLIDYVESDDYQYELGNQGATANIVANSEINIGGTKVDVSTLTPALLADLNEIGGSESNVATGYHAVEFLLWGQDLHGFDAGNGERPVTDYARGEDCTNGNCDRRAEYLDAVTDLLISDLEWMAAQWAPEQSNNYRAQLMAEAPEAGIQKMLFGMGSLSLGELAGERMKVALEANSYEDEHDCFSDNTHNSHYYNGQGVANVYTGNYTRVNGSKLNGPSLSALVAELNPALNDTLRSQLESSMSALATLKSAAEADADPMKFDMMIAPGNERGSEIVNGAILALVQQTGSIEQAARELGIESLASDDAGHAF
jgi:putative iron-regulated protein